MERFAFACVSTGLDIETQIFVASIRQFAGALSESPVWMFTPISEEKAPQNLNERYSSLNVEIIPVSVKPDYRKFPFATYVSVTAAAELFAKNRTEILAWLLTDTLIINSPTHFLLPQNKTLGYRPVHHTLIGSIYDDPIDPFWNLIYDKLNVNENNVFPMKAHVDHNILRPYFNAGFLVIRPEAGLLNLWWSSFKELYNDPSFNEFYKQDEKYSIFMHQAVLAGVILSTKGKEELLELPFTYNYPLHLYHESPPEYQPEKINDLTTARYENVEWLKKVTIQEPLKSWLDEQVKSISESEKK